MFRVRLTRKEFEGLSEFKFHRGPTGLFHNKLRIADAEFHDTSSAFYFVSTIYNANSNEVSKLHVEQLLFYTTIIRPII